MSDLLERVQTLLGDALAVYDLPIYDLVFDTEGNLWANSGGLGLLRIDPDSGDLLESFHIEEQPDSL